MAGAFEAIGPEPVATVPVPMVREAMSRLGAAVHVVTTAGPGGNTGFTATAVCSVSDAPPTLLVCLNRRNHSAPSCTRTRCSASIRWAPIARPSPTCSRDAPAPALEQRFGTGEWTTLKTGAPMLASAVIALDCRVVEIKAVASHNVIFGAVVDMRLWAGRPRARLPRPSV